MYVHFGGRLVEAERGGEQALQRGVTHEVVAAERLLDHEQRVAVELPEVIGVGRGVGRVGVGHERRVRP